MGFNVWNEHFYMGGSSKFKVVFGDGPIKEAHCKTTPLPLPHKTKILKRHPE
jgi:hypothetical protein